MSQLSSYHFPRAGFVRRLSSWVYDLLIAVAVYMVSGAVSFLLIAMVLDFGLIGMGGYQHVSDKISNTVWLLALNELWKIYWVSYFFVFFWCKSGQTIGMKAWRLRVQNRDGSLITKKTAWLRLLFTGVGLGNLMVLVNRKKLSVQDALTDTEIVVLSIDANKGRL